MLSASGWVLRAKRLAKRSPNRAALISLAVAHVFLVVLYFCSHGSKLEGVLENNTVPSYNAMRDILIVPMEDNSFLCEYSIEADQVDGGCVQQCAVPNVSNENFTCYIRNNRAKEPFKIADVTINHRGTPPDTKRKTVPPYLTLFYTGESNESLGYHGSDEYLRLHDLYISCHQHRKYYFTWARHHASLFSDIVEQNRVEAVSEQELWNDWSARHSAIAVFFTAGGSRRDDLVKELGKYYPVHKYGRKGRTNSTPPECAHLQNSRYELKICVFRNYKYAIALENTEETDYVTEKVYHALLAGSIPIYWGAPNADEFVPMGYRSIIDVEEFLPERMGRRGDWDYSNVSEEVLRLASHLRKLEADEAAVKHKLSWRTVTDEHKWGPKFFDNLHHRDPTCDICTEALVKRREMRQRDSHK
ncbi:hypothetical protein TRVL_07639 [Trypanosoma vivax]|nr:hypothetical protein TRVL_07639 [Trypanosoma vivax]